MSNECEISLGGNSHQHANQRDVGHRIQQVHKETSEKIVIMHGRPRVKDVGPQNPEKVKAAEKKVRTGGTFVCIHGTLEGQQCYICTGRVVWRTVSPCVGGKAAETV
jgi:hypothetical protein